MTVTKDRAAAAAATARPYVERALRDKELRDNIRNEPQWVGSVAYFPESYGKLIMPLAIALANGETVPEQLLVTHIFINKDNIAQYYPE